MLADHAPRMFAAVLSATCVAGCTPRAPAGVLPKPEQVATDVYGSLIWVSATESRSDTLPRELVAVAPDSIYVVDHGGVSAIAIDAIDEAHIEYYAPGGRTGLLSFLGFLSTASNGYFLIFTGPAWGITGALAASSVRNAAVPNAVHDATSNNRASRAGAWKELSVYARYPGGLPPGLDRSEVRPRPGLRGSRQ